MFWVGALRITKRIVSAPRSVKRLFLTTVREVMALLVEGIKQAIRLAMVAIVIWVSWAYSLLLYVVEAEGVTSKAVHALTLAIFLPILVAVAAWLILFYIPTQLMRLQLISAKNSIEIVHYVSEQQEEIRQTRTVAFGTGRQLSARFRR